MQTVKERDYVTERLPHGSLWSRGLRLAEAEIGRGPEPSGRWSRKPVAAGSPGAARLAAAAPAEPGWPARPTASAAARPWPRDAWTLETGPADSGTESVRRESLAAQAA